MTQSENENILTHKHCYMNEQELLLKPTAELVVMSEELIHKIKEVMATDKNPFKRQQYFEDLQMISSIIKRRNN